jgi:hypothetical protein
MENDRSKKLDGVKKKRPVIDIFKDEEKESCSSCS